MNTPLEDRLQELRRRIRRLLLLNGLAWLVTVLVGSMAIVGIMDWLLHFDDPGVRLILSLAVVAGTAYVAYRWLIAPLRVTLSDLDLALRIERMHPGLKDSFASTVQFLDGEINPTVGSPDLQRRVVDQTIQELNRIDFDDVVETRHVNRIVIAAIVVCLSAGLIVGFNTADASIALKRMALPLSATQWPKQTVLRVLDNDLQTVHAPDVPLRIALGESAKLHVDTARGHLPANGTIHFRFPDDQHSSQPLSPQSINDSDGNSREIYAFSLMVLEGPILFRVEAGDDREMPWYTIHAVVPPALEEMQVRLTPPAYTGKPAVDLPLGTGHVEALLGTKVELNARTDKPLISADIHVGDESEPLSLSEDAQGFSAAFSVTEKGSSTYWLAFRDRESLDEGQSRHYDLRGIEDRVPSVEMTRPATNLQVTPQATVPLRIVAKDDLGVRAIRLVYRSTADGTDSDTANPHVISLFEEQTLPQHQDAEFELDLAPLKLQPGDTVVLHAEATDAYDLGEEHIGRSLPRTLTVVSADEKKRELADRQADLMAELENVQKHQDAAHEQVRQLQIQLEESGNLRPQDVDTLQRVEMMQRRVTQQLAGKDQGIKQRAKQLLDDLRNNKIDDPDSVARMEKLDGELDRLGREHLPQIEEKLTAVRKRNQAAQAPIQKRDPATEQPNPQAPENGKQADAASKQALEKAGEHQQIVLEAINESLREMAQWRTHRDLARDLETIIEGQQTVTEETEKTGEKTVTKSVPDLTAQEKSDLKKLAERQRQAAKRIDKLQSKIQETARSRDDSESAESELLEDISQQMREQDIAGRMREAARQLQQNDTGAAGQNQQQLMRQLRDLHDTFHNRRETDTATLIKKLKKAEDELSQLRDKQQDLLRKLKKAEEIADEQQRRDELAKLKKQQQQLRKQAAQIARRLQRLQIRPAQDATRRAAERLQKTEQNLNQDDPIAAREQAQEAVEDLEQAQRELAQKRREAEEKLAQEQLEKIADQLKAMIPRQQGVIDETRRLDEVHRQKGKWSRGTLRSLRDLAEIERGLREETERLIETLTAAEVFALALKGAAREMDRAADLLAKRKTDDATIRHEERAKQRFIDLIEALKTDDKKQDQQQQQNQTPGGQQATPPTDGIPNLAQLKMLKTMQQDLMDRTAEIAARIEGQGNIDAADQQELQDLALEQSELADLARNLTSFATAGSQQDPATEPNDQEAEQE